MVCDHLKALENSLLERGYAVTFRGQTWTRNCREWVYFDCILALDDIRRAFSFDPCVIDQVHRGTHDGSEQGLVCSQHWDAVMGAHPDSGSRSVFRGFASDRP